VTDRHLSDSRVDELRQHLKALGYLDAGVDRFVLGPAQATRSPALIALLASLRIGVIAGVLLGPAAAIGIAARIPGLVTGTRDAIVLAMYSGALFGAAVTIAALAASTLLATFARVRAARHARLLARGAGTVVAVACLGYLTLWWRTTNAGADWSAPVWTAFALVVAVAISLLLGHAVAVMTLAMVMARAPHTTDVRASSLFSWKLSLGAGALAFAGAAVLLVLTAPAESRGAQSVPVLTVVPSGLRVRVIAIDGFDTATFDELSKRGELPALTAAFSGARARLAAEDTRDPARAWTTIATGQPPDAHGVYGLETRRLAGVQGSVPLAARSGAVRLIQAASDLLRLTRPSLASGEERRVKTLWEVAADSGLRTVVVNWWATWPAPAQSTATILSDRAALRLELGGSLDAEIAPAALYGQLRSDWTEIRRTAAGRAAALEPITHTMTDRAMGEVMQRSGELDALQLELADRVRGNEPDLLTVYLPGLDIAQHTLFGEGTAQHTPSAVAARLEALRGYYRFLDGLLGGVLVPAQSELVFLVTGPGRIAATATGWLTMRGPVARETRVDARAPDVAPTILYALGLPLSRELAGRPLSELFVEGHVERYPVRDVATYGRPSTVTSPRSGQPLDEEMIERLRSLGYVR
jgi:Type I phosphodiesterase / nucleotide pyrophosphatase